MENRSSCIIWPASSIARSKKNSMFATMMFSRLRSSVLQSLFLSVLAVLSTTFCGRSSVEIFRISPFLARSASGACSAHAGILPPAGQTSRPFSYARRQ